MGVGVCVGGVWGLLHLWIILNGLFSSTFIVVSLLYVHSTETVTITWNILLVCIEKHKTWAVEWEKTYGYEMQIELFNFSATFFTMSFYAQDTAKDSATVKRIHQMHVYTGKTAQKPVKN